MAKEIIDINKNEGEGNYFNEEEERTMDFKRKKGNTSSGERRSVRLKNKKGRVRRKNARSDPKISKWKTRWKI